MRKINSIVPPVTIAFLLLFVFAPAGALGQESVVINADHQFRFAESYFSRGEYYKAIGEYERFLHFFPEDERAEMAMFKIGASYLKGRRFSDATRAFTALIDRFRDSELAVRSYFKVAESYLERQQYDMARTALDNLLLITKDSDVRDEVFYRQGWIYLEVDQWEKARESFDRISAKNREAYRLKQLSEEMNKKKSLTTKNPTAAGLLAILPGAGHLYCERPRDAFIAFLLNGGMILAAVEAFDNDNEALGGLITFFELGLYSGNIYSAVNSAHKYNRRQKQDFFQYLKQFTVVQVSALTMDDHPALALSCRISF